MAGVRSPATSPVLPRGIAEPRRSIANVRVYQQSIVTRVTRTTTHLTTPGGRSTSMSAVPRTAPMQTTRAEPAGSALGGSSRGSDELQCFGVVAGGRVAAAAVDQRR